MDAQVKTMAICVLCKCGLDTTRPHAIVHHDYAHLDCADRYDSRDLGGMDLPPYVEDQWPEREMDDSPLKDSAEEADLW